MSAGPDPHWTIFVAPDARFVRPDPAAVEIEVTVRVHRGAVAYSSSGSSVLSRRLRQVRCLLRSSDPACCCPLPAGPQNLSEARGPLEPGLIRRGVRHSPRPTPGSELRRRRISRFPGCDCQCKSLFEPLHPPGEHSHGFSPVPQLSIAVFQQPSRRVRQSSPPSNAQHLFPRVQRVRSRARVVLRAGVPPSPTCVIISVPSFSACCRDVFCIAHSSRINGLRYVLVICMPAPPKPAQAGVRAGENRLRLHGAVFQGTQSLPVFRGGFPSPRSG